MSFFGVNNALASSTPAKPGGVFGSAAPATAPSFGALTFGTAANTSGFGTPSTSTAAPTLGGFGGFGTNTTTSTAALPTLGGFGGFSSAPTATAAPTLFAGTGLTTTTINTGFGFGSNTATSTAPPPAFGFGTTTAQTSTGFSGFGASAATSTTSTAPTFGGFGTGTSGFSGFGSNFGKPGTSTVTPGFGGFGGATNFMLGQPQQQPLHQITPDEAFVQSISNVSIYGDERDTLIAKWNYLQAKWGTGKSFYSQSAAPVDITPENYFCRLKAISYCRLPGVENKVGLVALMFNKPFGELRAQKQQIQNSLNVIFGNKPQITITIDSEKEQEDKKSRLTIHVEEKSQLAPMEAKRIPATEVAAYLNQMHIKSQLSNIGVYEVTPLTLPDEDQIKAYLETPPKGIDPRMWRQAKLDNPDPSKFLPVPIIGFSHLKYRIKCQESETEMQALFLRNIEKEITELRQKHVATTSKIKEYKRQLAELSHKILKIIVKQECSRKVGLPLTPEEEALRTKLENMQALVSAPNQFKGRLSELLSQMRMQRNQYTSFAVSEYTLDKECEDEMKQFLSMQQKALEVLSETLKKDSKALQIILEGMPKLEQS